MASMYLIVEKNYRLLFLAPRLELFRLATFFEDFRLLDFFDFAFAIF